MATWTLARVACTVGTLAIAACSKSGPPSRPPLTELPQLVNVKPTIRGDSATIVFDPFAGAKDYRVYPAPKEADILDGGVAIKNAIYRCSGDREGPAVPTDDEPQVPGGAMKTLVEHDVMGFKRSRPDATIGHVYPSPGASRTPVYVLGDPAHDGDNPCYFQRWTESRVKKYVTSDSERASLIAAGWRDDGIGFYVPSAPSAATRPVFTAVQDPTRVYFIDGPEKTARAALNPQEAFSVLSAGENGTEPLMRVHYANGCGKSHDELVRGQPRFDRAVRQGPTPIYSVLWTGLTAATTLVVEALDVGCPFQGHLSPVAFPPQGTLYQAHVTLDQVRAAAPNGEVYVNGQHDPQNRPLAIARSYVDVSPGAPEAFDFRDGFNDGISPGPLTEVPGASFQSKHYETADYDISFHSVEFPQFSIGQMLGELWVTYADWAADTNGKFRLTPKRKATLAVSAFLHVTMEVDIVSTSRRYPQILISDRDPPIQSALPEGTTIVVQPFGEWPARIDVEFCDHRTWEVNNQCPRFPLRPDSFSGLPLPPHAEVGDLMGVDRRVLFDVYASTSRVYVLLDGKPWGCADLPAGKMPAGPVSVTFGDVLYHSGVDVEQPWYVFHHKRMQLETRRHFDEIGFKSGVGAPAWDEKILPCVSKLIP